MSWAGRWGHPAGGLRFLQLPLEPERGQLPWATTNSRATPDPVIPALLDRVRYRNRKNRCPMEREGSLILGIWLTGLWGLANPNSAGQKAGKRAGFLHCSLEAKCLLLRDTSVFALRAFN